MVDIVLLAGKLLFLALLYLFLYAAVRTGIGIVTGSGPERSGALVLHVIQGPEPLRGTRLPLIGPVVIGRSPGADIVISDDFISAKHARVSPTGSGALVEDLGSTNGTVLDGERVTSPVAVTAGATIELGTVKLTVERS